MHPRTLRAAAGTVALSVALALSVSGCGGGDKPDRLSAAEFRTKTDAICTAANKKADAIGNDLGESPSAAEKDDAVLALADLLDDQIDDIAALEPPASMSDDVDAMLTSLRKGGATLRALKGKLFDQDENPLADASAKAADLGLKVCGA